MSSLVLSKLISRQSTIVILPVLVFVLGEVLFTYLHHPDIWLVTVCKPCVSKFPYSIIYTLAATFSLALLVAAIVICHSISQLARTSSDRRWIICYVTLGFLGFIAFFVIKIISPSSLDNYIALIPDYCLLTFSQIHINMMLFVVNTTFVLASFGVVLSAASLTNKTTAREVIKCLYQLRTILMQGLAIFITGMIFMHFWMKYTIEVGVPKEIRKEMIDLAIGIQFYHAMLFLSIILVLAMLTHHSLRNDYEKSIKRFETKAKTRMHEEWRSAVSYYREFMTAIGLFIPPVLGSINIT